MTTGPLHHNNCFFIFLRIALSAVGILGKQYFFQHRSQHCHCEPNIQCYEDDGTCPKDKCSEPHFGINCQHVNVNLSMTKSPINVPKALLDGNDSTCLKQSQQWNGISTFELDQPTHYIWVYVYRKSYQTMNPKILLFKNKKKLTIDFYLLRLDPNSLLIKLNKSVVYDKMVLSDLPADACSLEVSLGRNLAFSSDAIIISASQGTYLRKAKNVIDGDIGSCFQIKVNGTGGEWWRTTLRHDARVNRILIRNNIRNTCGRWFLIINMYASNGTKVFGHKANIVRSPGYQGLRTTDNIHVAVNDLVKKVEITLRGNLSQNCGITTTMKTLCEIFIYGEFRCPDDMFGALCDRNCTHGCTRETCDPDWGCPLGCHDGWIGDWCSEQKSCQFRYGPNCKYVCPEECGGLGDCNRDSGVCLAGCKAGYLPPNCSDTCLPGTFDVNCSKTCFHCARNTTTNDYACDFASGRCTLGCGEGFSGDDCEEINVADDAMAKVRKYGLAAGLLFALLLCYKSATREEEVSSEEEGSQELPQQNTGEPTQQHQLKEEPELVTMEQNGDAEVEDVESSIDPEPPQEKPKPVAVVEQKEEPVENVAKENEVAKVEIVVDEVGPPAKEPTEVSSSASASTEESEKPAPVPIEEPKIASSKGQPSTSKDATSIPSPVVNTKPDPPPPSKEVVAKPDSPPPSKEVIAKPDPPPPSKEVIAKPKEISTKVEKPPAEESKEKVLVLKPGQLMYLQKSSKNKYTVVKPKKR